MIHTQKDRLILLEAIDRLRSLCSAARGHYDRCSVDKLERVPTYIETWILPELQQLIEEPRCYHDNAKYVRENEVEIIEKCVECGEYLRHPKERC